MHSYSIPKQLVYAAWLKVKANAGVAGADNVSIVMFGNNLGNELYKLWSRMSSGSYMAPLVKRVEIAKSDGKLRPLGIPTVGDRVAQMVVKMTLEPEWDNKFHSSSFGYRPKRSAHHAVQAAKINCWKYSWVIDLDIKGFFDNLNHDQLQKFVAQATDNPWCKHKYESVPKNARSARAMGSISNPDRIFVFLFFPWIDHLHNSEIYRQERFACMQLYAWVSRLKFPSMNEIIVIGSATQGMKANSETILAIDATEKLTYAERQNVKKMMTEYNIFTNLKPMPKAPQKTRVSPVKKFLKPGRNEVCPCQSGRKFKRCCINRLDSSNI